MALSDFGTPPLTFLGVSAVEYEIQKVVYEKAHQRMAERETTWMQNLAILIGNEIAKRFK